MRIIAGHGHYHDHDHDRGRPIVEVQRDIGGTEDATSTCLSL